ncbi:MAG: CDP-alcohol phosphatidyltransferase family protein [Candidatus Omnitrophica bacterium]|nr:CDP-alcohol phosphatidyltransferase family protein [Candidatus Omnitrophota bacterium]
MSILSKQAANLITLLRVLLVFAVIYLLKSSNPIICLWGVLLLQIIFLMDGLDGYIAKKTKSANALGGLIDVLGDRITENLLFIFFAVHAVAPMYVALLFVVRSFVTDFVRSLSYKQGYSTYSIHTSALGYIFVASRSSRVVYLTMKFLLFTLGAISLFFIRLNSTYAMQIHMLPMLKQTIYAIANLLMAFSLLRCAFVIYDNRNVITQTFLKNVKNQ